MQGNDLIIRAKEMNPVAVETLWASVFPLAVRISGWHLKHGVSMDDLMAGARIGFIKALQTFERGMAYKFSTYSVYVMRRDITEVCAHESGLSRRMHYLIGKIAKMRRYYFNEHGRDPDDDALAEMIGVSSQVIRSYEERLRFCTGSSSLQEELPGAGGLSMQDMLPDMNIEGEPPGNEEIAAKRHTEEMISIVLNEITRVLNPRELQVINRRFGVNGGSGSGREEETLKAIAESFGVSSERIRQIQLEALKKIRESAKRKALESLGLELLL
jgi:RNA polymerase sigma factor (sigma-70 family)